MNNTPVIFTKYVSNKPLSKSYAIVDGKINKQAAAQMTNGTATLVKLNFADFSDALSQADHSTAFGYGVFKGPPSSSKQIVTKKRIAEYPNAITRSKDFFSYATGPGILMIDYDPDSCSKNNVTIDEFINILSKIIPGLSSAAYIIRGSISSCVHFKGSPRPKNDGHHFYILVLDASDIPRFGEALFKHLWLNGYGYIAHSANGSQLVRTITDVAVYSPERLDFVGTPILNDDTLQYSQPTTLINDGSYLDTACLSDLNGAELNQYDALVNNAKKNSEKKATEIKNLWLSKKEKQLINHGNSTNQAKDVISQLTSSQSKNTTLPGHYILDFQEFGEVSVNEILNNPYKFNDKPLADPIEGAVYGETTAKLWVNDGKPVIHSFAHGGRTYYLPDGKEGKKTINKHTIKLIVGEKSSIIDQFINLLLDNAQLYVHSGQLVKILHDESTGGDQQNKSLKIVAIDALNVTEILMSLANFTKKNSKGFWVATNLTADYANTLLARNTWPLPKLGGIIYTPTLRKDGSVITKCGYDKESTLYLNYDATEFPDIVQTASLSDAKKALEILKEPYKYFPFKESSDLSTVIAAILTSLVRHTVDNAPLFLITANKMGSGKGLIVSSIAELATGNPASVMSQASDSNEERKRLMALLLEGDSVICIDNIERDFGSDSLCSILTMPIFKDRLLGKSVMVSASTKATFLATGNNVTVMGDLTRRVLPCTLDAKVEKPFEREFSVHLPSFIKSNRGKLVNAALTILSAYQHAERPNQKLKPFGSFEEWSNMVRNAIVWCGMDDPCNGLILWDQMDPVRAELGAVLESWYAINKSQAITISELIKKAKLHLSGEFRGSESKVKIENLYNALFNVCEKNGALNPKVLGSWIQKNINRIEYNYKFEIAGYSGTRKKYKVTQCT